MPKEACCKITTKHKIKLQVPEGFYRLEQSLLNY